MKRLFLFIGNLAACIVENVSTPAEEQQLCKPCSRRNELFRTNHFKVSDEIKPHNKKQEIPQQSLRVLTFFYRKPFLLQFLQSPGTCSIREQSNFTNLVMQGNTSILTSCQFTNQPNREISRGVFQNRGVCGQAFPLLPSSSPFHLFFFCSRANFRAVTRLETLATQATTSQQQRNPKKSC